MCVTDIYVDVYPDGQRRTFSQVSLCQYGVPTGRLCSNASIIENPSRKITWDEPSTEYMFSQAPRLFSTLPLTPPRSSAGSIHRHSAGYVSSTSDEGLRRQDSKRHSSRHSSNSRRSETSRTKEAKREHRKERIIIVEAPPTPRTPPRSFAQTFTAPNSPMSRSRPIIVDERPRPQRVPSVGAVVGDRPRRSTSSTRPRFGWDSPSSSHTSFDLQTAAEERARAEARHLKAESAAKLEVERRRAEARREEAKREEQYAELEAQRRQAERIRAHDEAIKRRPAVPLKTKPFLAPTVDQTNDVQGMMGGLRLDERVSTSTESRRRMEDREIEAMSSRLRERQMPGRRFSVGPAQRRERALYSDNVYRYE